MRALKQHMLLSCTPALKAGFYFTLFSQLHSRLPLCWIPTCLFLESHWESLTKTGRSECESVPLASSPCTRAGHLTTSSGLGQVGPLDQTWETRAATTAKLLHSPSGFRQLCPPQPPQPLLFSSPCRCQLFCSARSHRNTWKKIHPVNPVLLSVRVWGGWV